MILSGLILAGLLRSQALDEARALAARGDFESAKTVLEEEVERSPAAPAFAFLSQLQVITDAIPQGAQSLARALELAPEQHVWRTTLGALYYRLGKLDEAERELDRALQTRSSPIAQYYLGSVYKARGDLARAEERALLASEQMPPEPIENVLERLDFPPSVNALFLLAEIQMELGRDVEPLLRRILELEPTHPGPRYLLARILIKAGRKEEGKKELEIFDGARRAHDHLLLALNFRQAGNDERTFHELRLALEAYPDHPRALYFLARELATRGASDEAEELFARLVEIEPRAKALVEALRPPK